MAEVVWKEKSDGGGPAFPLPDGAAPEGRRGMTLLQWYKGMALIGNLAHGAHGRSIAEVARDCDAMAAQMLYNDIQRAYTKDSPGQR